MFFRILSIMCLTWCLNGFTNEIVPQLDDALLSEIISTDHSCISNVIDDKVYIHPERIVPTEGGLFLSLDPDLFVEIPLLCSDSHGCYVQTGRYIKVTKPCPHCGCERTSGAWKCRNPDCPSNQPKDKSKK